MLSCQDVKHFRTSARSASSSGVARPPSRTYRKQSRVSCVCRRRHPSQLHLLRCSTAEYFCKKAFPMNVRVDSTGPCSVAPCMPLVYKSQRKVGGAAFCQLPTVNCQRLHVFPRHCQLCSLDCRFGFQQLPVGLPASAIFAPVPQILRPKERRRAVHLESSSTIGPAAQFRRPPLLPTQAGAYAQLRAFFAPEPTTAVRVQTS